MQTQQINTTAVKSDAMKSDAMKSAGKRTPARLTLVSDDRQIQQPTTKIISSREEAVRAAMLRTG